MCDICASPLAFTKKRLVIGREKELWTGRGYRSCESFLRARSCFISAVNRGPSQKPNKHSKSDLRSERIPVLFQGSRPVSPKSVSIGVFSPVLVPTIQSASETPRRSPRPRNDVTGEVDAVLRTSTIRSATASCSHRT